MSENKKQRSASVGCSDPRLRNSFIYYLNGHVTDRARKRIDSHLVNCSHCTGAIRLLALMKRIETSKSRDTHVPPMKK
jgi:predicted anti-sigma-YlaC factor YlaD